MWESRSLPAFFDKARCVRKPRRAFPCVHGELATDAWAANVIKAVGNYGEIFERNVGGLIPIRLERRLNGLWTDGGLMYAPLLRQSS